MITKTATILSILLLVSACLVQISWTSPTAEEDLCLLKSKYDISEPSEKNSQLSASTEMLKFTSIGLQKLSAKYAQDGKRISEELLKNDAILNSKSAKIQEFKQNLTKYEEQYLECDGLDALFKLAESYSNTTSFYYELEEAALDDDSKLILDLLRKSSSEQLDNEFEKYFDVFVEQFNKKFESLKDDLAKEATNVSKKLWDWFVHFKTLTAYDDKIVAFEKYFELYK